MNISKLFCMLIAGLAIIGFTTLGYASQEDASNVYEIESEAASEQEHAKEEADSAQSTEDVQYGAELKWESDEKEVKEEAKEEERE